MPVARCYTYSWNQDSFGERPTGVPLVSTPPNIRGSLPLQWASPTSTPTRPPT